MGLVSPRERVHRMDRVVNFVKSRHLKAAVTRYNNSVQHVTQELAQILDDVGSRIARSDIRWRYEYARNISNESEMGEVSQFNRAELLSNLLYPDYKFSDFGALWLKDTNVKTVFERFMDADNEVVPSLVELEVAVPRLTPALR